VEGDKGGLPDVTGPKTLFHQGRTFMRKRTQSGKDKRPVRTRWADHTQGIDGGRGPLRVAEGRKGDGFGELKDLQVGETGELRSEERVALQSTGGFNLRGEHGFEGSLKKDKSARDEKKKQQSRREERDLRRPILEKNVGNRRGSKGSSWEQ